MKDVNAIESHINWFDENKKNITSQSGEDGILEKIFEVIPGIDRWCCEFGAWDGKKYSNTYQLIANKNWSGVLIEANSKKFQDLYETFPEKNNVFFINKYVSFEGSDTLDNILGNTSIPREFDLLSIDIDGNDYHVWASLVVYQPKVVIIEYNQSIPNHIEFIQKADFNINHGNSILSLTKLANSKGYELVAVTDLNAIYVKSEFFSLFNINNNSLDLMRPCCPYVTEFFQLYDGTIVLEGYKKMIWHGLPLTDRNIQVVPRFLRYFPGVMSNFKLVLLKLFKIISGYS